MGLQNEKRKNKEEGVDVHGSLRQVVSVTGCGYGVTWSSPTSIPSVLVVEDGLITCSQSLHDMRIS
jgi:hypothetical protein